MFAHAVKSVSWAFAGKWFQTALSIATLAVTARILGPNPYGLFAAAMLIVSIGDMFVSGAPAALTQSLVQRQEINRGHQTATFWLCLAVGAALWLGVAFAGWVLSSAFEAHAVAVLLPYCGAFLLSNAIGSVPFAVLVREMRFRDVTLIESAGAVVASVLGISLAVAGAGVWSLVAMEAGRSATRTVLAFAVSRWLPGASARWSHLFDVGAINASVVTTAAVGYLDRNAPRIVVATLLGAQALGFYTIAMRLFDILSGLFIGPFSWVAMPIITRTRNDARALGGMLKSALRYSSLLSYPVFVGVAVVAPMLAPIALGSQWTPAILTIQLVTLIGVRSATGSLNTVVLIGMGHIWSPVVLQISGAVLSVSLCLLAAPWGIEAIAAAMLARALLTMPLASYMLKRATQIPILDLWRQSWPALVAVTVMAAVLLVVQAPLNQATGSFGALVISVPLGAVIYFAANSLLVRDFASTITTILQALIRRDSSRLEAVFNDAKP